ncbi:hypothetical protein MUNTM_53790 [Mycobacterium sp. MUNTM1]
MCHHAVERVPAFTDARRQPANRGRFEQHSHSDMGIQRGVDRGDDPHRRQRVPAQIEERIVNADPLQPEDLGVDADQDFLDRGGRGPVFTGGAFGRRERAGVKFSVGCQRQCLDGHHRGRHHVGRQPLGEPAADLGHIGGPGEVSDEPQGAPVLAGDHHRLPHPVQFG